MDKINYLDKDLYVLCNLLEESKHHLHLLSPPPTGHALDHAHSQLSVSPLILADEYERGGEVEHHAEGFAGEGGGVLKQVREGAKDIGPIAYPRPVTPRRDHAHQVKHVNQCLG